ncbi:MAG: hypothetical protein HUU41_17445, partial [Bryobacteraceae bacterium]|nr:hypothetical protein [Bryobacteraceae bacterium]
WWQVLLGLGFVLVTLFAPNGLGGLVGLTEAFSSDPARVVQWRAFVRHTRFDSGWELEQIVEQVRLFASWPLAAAAEDRPRDLNWQPGGPRK